MGRKNRAGILFLLAVGVLGSLCLSLKSESTETKLVLAGSEAMETFAVEIEKILRQEGIEIKLQFIGSSAGIEALHKKKAQLAMASRYLTKQEKAQGIVETIVAWDGIILVVNSKNPIDNLSREQLADIFSGKIRNWKEVGGLDCPILPIGRECGSGTRDSFEKLLGITGKSRYANECGSIGVIKTKAELLDGAIGYVSLETAENTLGDLKAGQSNRTYAKVLKIDNIEPSLSNIESGAYFLVRPFILASVGSLYEQAGEVQRIFEVLQEEKGGISFERAKIVPAEAGEAF